MNRICDSVINLTIPETLFCSWRRRAHHREGQGLRRQQPPGFVARVASVVRRRCHTVRRPRDAACQPQRQLVASCVRRGAGRHCRFFRKPPLIDCTKQFAAMDAQLPVEAPAPVRRDAREVCPTRLRAAALICTEADND